MSTLPGKDCSSRAPTSGSARRWPGNWRYVPRSADIYLACRNQDRAIAAKAELEAATGRRIFDIVLMDVADLDSVRAGLDAINGSVDALVMNAGVIGPQTFDAIDR